MINAMNVGNSKLRLGCFSPPVMLATFAIEITLALWTLWKYRHARLSLLVAATLVCLATFQLAEWMVCLGALGLSSYAWAQIGYLTITALPPLGIHIAMELRGKYHGPTLLLAYGTAVAFGWYFLAVTSGIGSSVCLGNYVIFAMAPAAVWLFTVYYYGWLCVGLWAAFWWARHETRPHIAASLRWLGVGYLSFMIPVTTANIIDPSTLRGIPSIMCGFAVLLAVILVTKVLPVYMQPSARQKAKKKRSR